MGNLTNEGNWAARERLRRIEFLLWWRGWVGRQDGMERFGISAAQASGDLQRYAELNPGSMVYQTRRKRYEGVPTMTWVLHEPSFSEAVRDLLGAAIPVMGVSAESAAVGMVAVPTRGCPPGVARSVMIALLEKRWLEVRYASLKSGTHERRRMRPGGLGWDGQRWHLRAWCAKNLDWRDFVLGRMSDAGWPVEESDDLPRDEDWETHETVRLRINPELSGERREALRLDYGMEGEVLEIRVRRAMKPYLLANCFIDEGHRELPRHFVVDA